MSRTLVLGGSLHPHLLLLRSHSIPRHLVDGLFLFLLLRGVLLELVSQFKARHLSPGFCPR